MLHSSILYVGFDTQMLFKFYKKELDILNIIYIFTLGNSKKS